MRQYGAIKDIPSEHDIQAKILLADAPREGLPLNLKYVANPKVFDQFEKMACTAFAAVGARCDERQYEGKPYVKFDADTLYAAIKQPHGGASLKDCCDVMLHRGMPVDSSSWWSGPLGRKSIIWDDQYKIGAYSRLTTDLTDDQIKQLIMTYGTFMASSPWDYNWKNMVLTNIFPEPCGKYDGWHCVRVYAWDDSIGGGSWGIVNSHGVVEWGVGGIAWMPYPMFREHVLAKGDCWQLQDSLSANRTLRRLAAIH